MACEDLQDLAENCAPQWTESERVSKQMKDLTACDGLLKHFKYKLLMSNLYFYLCLLLFCIFSLLDTSIYGFPPLKCSIIIR